MRGNGSVDVAVVPIWVTDIANDGMISLWSTLVAVCSDVKPDMQSMSFQTLPRRAGRQATTRLECKISYGEDKRKE